MDDQYYRQRNNDPSMRPTSTPRQQQPGQEASQRRWSRQTGSSSGDRQGVSLGGRGSSAGYSGYYQENPASAFSAGAGVPTGAMGYAQPVDYGQDTRQAQGFANAYNPAAAGMVYNVQQASGQSSVFDTAQSFSSRQPSGLPMMAQDVGATSYFPNESATAAATMHAQAASSGTSSAIYQHQNRNPGDGRPSISQDYSARIGVASAGLPSHASTPDPSAPASAGVDTRDYAEVNEAFNSYQKTLKEVFRSIRAGSLDPAADSLLEISIWLLSSVESLGLTADDENLYESRVKLWKNFNNAWLALLEKHKEMIWAGKQLHRSQSVVPFDKLQHLARELVRLCDGVERFGLVDYDYGVWEERIMSILTECVDLHGLEDDESSAAAVGSISHQG